MDKTFSDLMDIVNRSKKYDSPTPRQKERKVKPQVVDEEYSPIEYDIIEEKPKRQSPVRSTSSSFSNSKLGSLLEKTTKSTAKKSTATKSSSKTSTAKKSDTTKKASTKSTSTTKKTTAPKTNKLNALINNVGKTANAPDVENKKVDMPKFELPASINKVKPAKSVTEKTPANDKDAQLYAALKNSLFSGGTDISDYLTANEALEMSQQNYQDNHVKHEASKINEEITKEQQEYEQLFTGSFSTFYDIEDSNTTESFERDEKKPNDSTYELNTGNKNLDQKIADYYKRKQQMIDKYNSEEDDYIETKKTTDNNETVDYESIFGGTVISRDELFGNKEEQIIEETVNTEEPSEETTTEPITAENSAFAITEEQPISTENNTNMETFVENETLRTLADEINNTNIASTTEDIKPTTTETPAIENIATPFMSTEKVVTETPVVENSTETIPTETTTMKPTENQIANETVSNIVNEPVTEAYETTSTENTEEPLNSDVDNILYSDNKVANTEAEQTTNSSVESEATTKEENYTPYSNFTGVIENQTLVNGETFIMTPSEQPAGEVMEYSNQVPVDYTTMTKVEEIVENEEPKSILSSYISNTTQPVDDSEDDEEELVIKLKDNDTSISNIEESNDVENDEEKVTITFTDEDEDENMEETASTSIINTASNSLEENSLSNDNNISSTLIKENQMQEEKAYESIFNSPILEESTTETPNLSEVNNEENIATENKEITEVPNTLEEDTQETDFVEANEINNTENLTEDETLQQANVEDSSSETTEETETINNIEEATTTYNEQAINTNTDQELNIDQDQTIIATDDEGEESTDTTALAEENIESEQITETSDFETNPTLDSETISPTTLDTETKQLFESYLTEEEQYDYIVANEKLYEKQASQLNKNTSNNDLDTDDDNNTMIINKVPDTRFDIFSSQQTTPIVEEIKEITEEPIMEATNEVEDIQQNMTEQTKEEVTEEISEETTSEEKENNDTISKEEFYNEMARLQENLINELKGNTVEKSSYDFFAEQTKPEPAKEEMLTTENMVSENEKINSIVDELISSAPVKEEISVVEQVLNKNSELAQVEEKLETPIIETTPEVKETTPTENIGSKAEPVDPADFDKYNLLNKEIALNEEDLKVETLVAEVPDKEPCFYGSNEDQEKKATVIDDYMTIYNEETHASKEVGDINIFKNIGNAVPSSEILKENLSEQTTSSTDNKEDKELETIYTLMGIEKKPAQKEEKEIKVLYCASECQPFVASGGLADVAGSLPKAIAEKGGVDIRVIMPLYASIKAEYRDKFEYLGNFTVHLSWRQEYCGLFRYFKDGVTYYFIDNERYFKRDTLYGYYDDGERFAYFSKAIVEALPHLNFFPDIIHCNDWQTALVSAYVKTGNWSDHRYYKIRYVYTVHNIEYQGVYGMENLKDLFGIDYRFKNDVEYNGDINLTKTAIQYCDKLTTVSNSYCDNLKQPYCSRGLHHIIIRNEYKLSGIINGIDYDFYNPAHDPNILKNYDIGCIEEKVLNKKLWQDEIGLPVDGDTPMLAIVSRLVGHKGLDLVAKIIHNILQQDIQLVVVGTGEDKYVDLFHQLEQKYPTKVRAFVDKYSNEIARKAYAASDIFIMPSKIEPCGLSQMISSRYGSVPIVREVGGLKDTIRDFGCEGGGNGYTFANYNPNDLQYQIERAIKDYSNRTQWREKMQICMSQDFTWKKPAINYINLYKSISN